jgi:hypothetical protein
MNLNDNPIKSEQDLYDRINDYRKGLRTSALTSYDVQSFVKTQSSDLHPDIVFKNIILGNACSWGTYDRACEHFENNMYAFKQFQVFNM